MYKMYRNIHFVGVGGAGMSGIAEVLLNLGYRVSGSDLRKSPITERLEELGAAITYGHRPENVAQADVVVISSAIRSVNPEVVAARQRSIPVIRRAEMLAELMRLKYGIAVAGSHGKTTVTSMIAVILAAGGLDPTVVIGGRLDCLGSGAKLGHGEFMVAEADESDGSFLNLSPTIAVVTNIDSEHLDHYDSIENLRQAFIDFIHKIPFYGKAVLCHDAEGVQAILPKINKRYVTYGMTSSADLQAREIEADRLETSFVTTYRGSVLGSIRLQMPGVHHAMNALAAIAVGLELDIPFATIEEALEGFGGIERRFQIGGERDGVLVVDDYGHHPAEIRATLRAAKEGWHRRLIVAFQPHRYTRTRDLFDQFVTAFDEADLLIVTDIYAAGEDRIAGVRAERLAHAIRAHGHKGVSYIESFDAIVERLKEVSRPGDMVLTLGAGDIWQVGKAFLEPPQERCLPKGA